MKKILSILLSVTLLLALAACGGGGGQDGAPAKEAPDLNQYYEDFMASFPEDERPAMMDVEGDFISQYYPGLENIQTKQAVLKAAMIAMVAYEFALVEVENAADAQTVADIFQSRIDYQIENGAFYPMTLEGWENAEVVTQGNVVALIVAQGSQSQAVEAFNKLFA
ncbi:MAG: DUF4358 domain-containing protein [Oscillospiraceae bacterium]|nr:DUF4358 domain-containing protein [Oscillospiraceae bacterium]